MEVQIKKMKVSDLEYTSAKKSDEITLQVPSIVRRNDKVYLIKNIES